MLLSDQSCAMYGAFYTCQKHAMASSQHHMLILHFEDLFEEFCHRPIYTYAYISLIKLMSVLCGQSVLLQNLRWPSRYHTKLEMALYVSMLSMLFGIIHLMSVRTLWIGRQHACLVIIAINKLHAVVAYSEIRAVATALRIS